jgi:hypothetical protein
MESFGDFGIGNAERKIEDSRHFSLEKKKGF